MLYSSVSCSTKQTRADSETHSQTLERVRTLSPTWDVSIKSLPPVWAPEPWGRGGRENLRTRGMENTRRTRHEPSTQALAGTGQPHGLHSSVPGALGIRYGFQSSVLWDSWVSKWLGLWFFRIFLGSFPSVGLSCHVVVLLYGIIFCFVVFGCYLLEACFLPKWETE